MEKTPNNDTGVKNLQENELIKAVAYAIRDVGLAPDYGAEFSRDNEEERYFIESLAEKGYKIAKVD